MKIVPDDASKKMLSAVLESVETVFQSLDTPEKWQYTRLYAQVVSDICFLKLKHKYFEQYYHVAHHAKVCSSALSKEMIKENHLHRIQFITQGVMERHRQTIAEALNLAEEALNREKQSKMNQTIDTHQLSPVVLTFVRKDQFRLSAEFKWKVLLIQAFYELKPTEHQVLGPKRYSNKHVYLNV